MEFEHWDLKIKMSKKDIILKAENISKQYRLGVVGTGTLSHDFNRWWHRVRGKEDPYLKVGERFIPEKVLYVYSRFLYYITDSAGSKSVIYIYF